VITAPVTVECGDPLHGQSSRWATLKIMDVEVFTALVYDTDGEGNRTEEQAARNMLYLLGQNLRRLEDER
jgi:hypothetical protein